MRYAFGLLAVLCAVKFFKREKLAWMFFAGVACACGLFTSVEIGVCAFGGISAALISSSLFSVQERKEVFSALLVFLAGIALVALRFLSKHGPRPCFLH